MAGHNDDERRGEFQLPPLKTRIIRGPDAFERTRKRDGGVGVAADSQQQDQSDAGRTVIGNSPSAVIVILQRLQRLSAAAVVRTSLP
jgi:hypothetical protein